MGAETRTQHYSQQTLRQVRLDCNRAIIRARFCPERTNVLRLRCMDDRVETESAFGNQLWYFEGIGVDEYNRRRTVFGAVEYSMQFGLNELVAADQSTFYKLSANVFSHGIVSCRSCAK